MSCTHARPSPPRPDHLQDLSCHARTRAAHGFKSRSSSQRTPSGRVVSHTTPPTTTTANTVRKSAGNILLLFFLYFQCPFSFFFSLTSLIVLIFSKYFVCDFCLKFLLEDQSTPAKSELESVFSRNRGLRRRQRRKATVCVSVFICVYARGLWRGDE